MAITGSQLGQLRPAVTTPVSIYSPAVDIEAQLTQLIIANSTTSPAAFSMYHDDDGTVYDADTILYPEIIVNPKNAISLPLSKVFANVAAGNFAVQTDTANALTFTLYGLEKTLT